MNVNGPMFSVDARGGFGPGVVLAKWRESNWARVRVRTPQPRTKKQQEAKSRLIQRVRGFGGISEEQRQAWGQWGKTHPRTNSMGVQYFPSGCNYFTGNGVLQKIIEVGQSDDPPTEPAPGPFTLWWLEWDAPYGLIMFRWIKGLGGEFYQVWITSALNVGVSVENRDMYMVTALPDDYGQWGISDVWAGKRYGVGARYLNSDGQVGPMLIREIDLPLT